MIEVRNFIAGEFVAAASGEWLERRNPATNKVDAKFAASGHIDVVRAVQAANKAFPAWAKLETEARAKTLLAFAQALETRLEEIARTQSSETGVPILSSRGSARRGLLALETSARLALTRTEASVVAAQTQFAAHRLPVGVVGIIASWSDAAFFLLSRLGAALVAGNSVIVKPSSFAPGTAALITEIAHQSGLPAGVFNLVQGRGGAVGELFVEHPGVSTIAFSGRTETGREIQRKAAEFLKRTQLALSGCNSALVFAENDLEKTAAKVARLCFSQIFPLPLKASRLFVQESVYDRFLELLKGEAAKLEIGDPLAEKTRLGPLIDRNAVVRHEAWIDQAASEKGKILFGGKGILTGLDPSLQAGNFARPTAIYDLTLCSTLQQEEAVGPSCLIASFKYQHDAVKHANTSPFGQAAHVFHANASKVGRIAQKIEAGRVFINPTDVIWDPRLAYGGLKDSGLGREGALATMNFFSKEIWIGQDLRD